MINMPLSIGPLCLCVDCGKVFSTSSWKGSGENLGGSCRDREELGDARVKTGQQDRARQVEAPVDRLGAQNKQNKVRREPCVS
jgi:hypothetical protein